MLGDVAKEIGVVHGSVLRSQALGICDDDAGFEADRFLGAKIGLREGLECIVPPVAFVVRQFDALHAGVVQLCQRLCGSLSTVKVLRSELASNSERSVQCVLEIGRESIEGRPPKAMLEYGHVHAHLREVGRQRVGGDLRADELVDRVIGVRPGAAGEDRYGDQRRAQRATTDAEY